MKHNYSSSNPFPNTTFGSNDLFKKAIEAELETIEKEGYDTFNDTDNTDCNDNDSYKCEKSSLYDPNVITKSEFNKLMGHISSSPFLGMSTTCPDYKKWYDDYIHNIFLYLYNCKFIPRHMVREYFSFGLDKVALTVAAKFNPELGNFFHYFNRSIKHIMTTIKSRKPEKHGKIYVHNITDMLGDCSDATNEEFMDYLSNSAAIYAPGDTEESIERYNELLANIILKYKSCRADKRLAVSVILTARLYNQFGVSMEHNGLSDCEFFNRSTYEYCKEHGPLSQKAIAMLLGRTESNTSRTWNSFTNKMAA